MNASYQPNDHLCRLWQEEDRPTSDREAQRIMELVQERAKSFERTIFRRNIREYIAAAFVAVVFALMASIAKTAMERVGHIIVGAGAVWIMVFMWFMQRATQAPLPESSVEAYKEALLARYDRQILLTRTAWAWYVLPISTGLVTGALGHNIPLGARFTVAGFLLAVGAAIAIWNWKAATKLQAEKREMERMFLESESVAM